MLELVNGDRVEDEFYEELGEGEELIDEVVEFYLDGELIELSEEDYEEDVEIYDYEYSFEEDDNSLDELYDDISTDMLNFPSDKDYIKKVKEGIINGEDVKEDEDYSEIKELNEDEDISTEEDMVYDIDFDDIYVEVETGD